MTKTLNKVIPYHVYNFNIFSSGLTNYSTFRITITALYLKSLIFAYITVWLMLSLPLCTDCNRYQSDILDLRMWSTSPFSTNCRDVANRVRLPVFSPHDTVCPGAEVPSSRLEKREAASSEVACSDMKHWRRLVIRVRITPDTGDVNSIRASSSATCQW